MAASRAVRNNNPLNIRINAKNAWQGRIPLDRNTDGTFEQFVNARMGFRAAAVLIIKHFDFDGATTIQKLVAIWAPPSENDTASYIAFVSQETGLASDKPLNLHSCADLAPVVMAMAKQESGGWFFSDDDLRSGLILAGVQPPVTAIANDRSVKAATTATMSVAGLGAVTATLQQVQPALSVIQQIHSWWPELSIAVLVAALSAIVVFRIQDWRHAK